MREEQHMGKENDETGFEGEEKSKTRSKAQNLKGKIRENKLVKRIRRRTGPRNTKVCDRLQIKNDDSDWLVVSLLNKMCIQRS